MFKWFWTIFSLGAPDHSARKTTVSKLKKAKIVSSEYIANVKGHRSINFPQRLQRSRWRRATMTLSCNRPRLNEIMKTSVLRKCKYYIQLILAVSNITTTGAPLTHRWQRRKKTNCQLHFRVVNLKNFSMNPAVMESQEQTMMNSH